MTRLRTEDIKYITRELEAYDRQLLDKTGKTLEEVASHAVGLLDPEIGEIDKRRRFCVVPFTSGQGVIDLFSDTVNGIIRHLGFDSFVADHPDVTGISEAFERDSDVILLADDHRFVAINLHNQRVSDNSEMTARGFVAALDLMANGLDGKAVLVIGCGDVGGFSTKTLVAMGSSVSIYDIDPQASVTLEKEILEQLRTTVQIDNNWRTEPRYQCIVDATPAEGLIDTSLITDNTCIVVPGFPCGVSEKARRALSKRYLHDPLQIGVATMVMDACRE